MATTPSRNAGRQKTCFYINRERPTSATFRAFVVSRVGVSAKARTIDQVRAGNLRHRRLRGASNTRHRGKRDIDSTTPHHHFLTKADLAVAVAEELKSRFQSDEAPSTAVAPQTSIAALQRRFADADYYGLHEAELHGAYREFIARAPRDPMIARLVKQLNETWRQDTLKNSETSM